MNPQNKSSFGKLSESFNHLLAGEKFTSVINRMEKRNFNNKMEKFLEEIKGILYLY